VDAMNRRYFPTVVRERNEYPTSDFRPMAETDFHRKLMTLVIDTLIAWFEGRPDVYVSGNLLVFYEKGNKRRHVAPDCFVVFGVPNYDRQNFLIWDEGRSPAVVIEITSKTTRAEDTKKKFALYRDVLRVPEYYLFDPKAEYLKPSLQGFRSVDGVYVPIEPADERFPSQQLGLHLARDGQLLRFWNPATQGNVSTPVERLSVERQLLEAETEQLRQEIEALRRRLGEKP
jgi:Uma2 family endonuclease